MVYTPLGWLKKNSISTLTITLLTAGGTSVGVAETAIFTAADASLITKYIVLAPDNASEIIPEEITITARSATSGAGNITGLTRGVNADGTIGAAHEWPIGTRVFITPTIGLFNAIKASLEAHESLKAPLASPTFTGTPAAPTASAMTNTTQLATTAFVTAATREKLTAARTYYVRTDGNDSNTGLVNNAGGAFLTIQKAYDVISSTIDLAGYAVTVQIGDGTYTAGVNISKGWAGAGAINFQGNTGNMNSVIISVTGGNCIYVGTVLPATLSFLYMKLQTTTSGNCISHDGMGLIVFNNINFGACAGSHMYTAVSGGYVRCLFGTYTISGNVNIHLQTDSGSRIDVYGTAVTVSGTPAFGIAFAYNRNASTCRGAASYAGSATGKRYDVALNAVLDSNAVTLPGNAAGSTATGGQYV